MTTFEPHRQVQFDGEFKVEWSPPLGEVFAPDAFAGSIGKPVRLTGFPGAGTGTLVAATVAPDGTSATLTISPEAAPDQPRSALTDTPPPVQVLAETHHHEL